MAAAFCSRSESQVSPSPTDCGNSVVGNGFLARPSPPPRAPVGKSVQTFDVSRAANSQARHIRSRAERADLFFRAHQREDVIDASFNGQAWILKRVLILLSPGQACD